MQTNIRKVRSLGSLFDRYEVLLQGEWKNLESETSEKVLKIYEVLKDHEEVKSFFVFDEKKGDIELRF